MLILDERRYSYHLKDLSFASSSLIISNAVGQDLQGTAGGPRSLSDWAWLARLRGMWEEMVKMFLKAIVEPFTSPLASHLLDS